MLELKLIGGTDLCLHLLTYFVVLQRIVGRSECKWVRRQELRLFSSSGRIPIGPQRYYNAEHRSLSSSSEQLDTQWGNEISHCRMRPISGWYITFHWSLDINYMRLGWLYWPQKGYDTIDRNFSCEIICIVKNYKNQVKTSAIVHYFTAQFAVQWCREYKWAFNIFLACTFKGYSAITLSSKQLTFYFPKYSNHCTSMDDEALWN